MTSRRLLHACMADRERAQRAGAVTGLRFAEVKEITDDGYILQWLSGAVRSPSAPARAASFMAGKERGAYFPFEVGDEVVVGFDDGNLDQPVILGALWSDIDAPPRRSTPSDTNNTARSSRAQAASSPSTTPRARPRCSSSRPAAWRSCSTTSSKNLTLQVRRQHQDRALDAAGRHGHGLHDQPELRRAHDRRSPARRPSPLLPGRLSRAAGRHRRRQPERASRSGVFVARAGDRFDGTPGDAGDVLDARTSPSPTCRPRGRSGYESEIAPWKPDADVVVVDDLDNFLTPASRPRRPRRCRPITVTSKHVFGTVAIDRGAGFGAGDRAHSAGWPRGARRASSSPAARRRRRCLVAEASMPTVRPARRIRQRASRTVSPCPGEASSPPATGCASPTASGRVTTVTIPAAPCCRHPGRRSRSIRR